MATNTTNPAAGERDDRSVFDNWAKRKVREVHDEYDINVPMKYVDVSTKDYKNRYGVAKCYGENEYEIVLSHSHYVDYGEERMSETVRHEWAHVIQYHIGGVSGHGNTFSYLAEHLDFPDDRYESSRNAKYRLYCTTEGCPIFTAKTRKSKFVKQALDPHMNMGCERCGNLDSVEAEHINHTKVMRDLRNDAFKESGDTGEEKDTVEQMLENHKLSA